MGKPGRQVFRHRIAAEMQQGPVAEGLAGVETFQGYLQRVRAALKLRLRPGHHLSVFPYPFPGR